MTLKLYEQEPYQTTFHAHVISCIKKNELYDIILDQTLFFPEEGGQTCDKGTLNGIDVVDVQIINDEIHHYTHSALNGDVQGIIDWTHRYTNMQHHTGEHILSGLIHKEFHVDNVGFHLGYNEITADYAMDLNNDQIKRIEALVNSVIFSNKPVKTLPISSFHSSLFTIPFFLVLGLYELNFSLNSRFQTAFISPLSTFSPRLDKVHRHKRHQYDAYR